MAKTFRSPEEREDLRARYTGWPYDPPIQSITVLLDHAEAADARIADLKAEITLLRKELNMYKRLYQDLETP